MKRTATVMLLVAASALPLAAQTAPPKHPSRSRITPQAVSEKVNWTSGVSYTYDGAGNVISIGADKFVYDDVGRLVQAVINGEQRNYTYDAFGNRKTCMSATGGDCQFGVDHISESNRMTLATYDPQGSGNVTQFGPHNYSYDAVNMMTRDEYGTETADFIYTADDERIAVYAPSKKSWQWTVRDTGNKLLREFTSKDEDGSSTPGTLSWKWAKDYVWRDGMLLASRQFEKEDVVSTRHYHLDHLGTPRRITDQKDAIVGFHDYYAFGPEVSGGMPESPRTDLKYTAHERDRHSDLYSLDYMHARYYNFSMGRFLSVDPLLDVQRSTREPQSWNRYSYCINNPVNRTDPDGRMDGNGMGEPLEWLAGGLDRAQQLEVSNATAVRTAKGTVASLSLMAGGAGVYAFATNAAFRTSVLMNAMGFGIGMTGGPSGFRVSNLAPDWATKGFHIHVKGVELAMRPGQNGTIVFKQVFSSTSAAAAKEAIKVAETALKDPATRQMLYGQAARARTYLATGDALARGRSGEMNFLMKALEKMGF